MNIDIPDNKGPKVGDRIHYRNLRVVKVGTCVAVNGNIADVDYGDGRDPADHGFIWRFHDGLNCLHDWPGKDKAMECRRLREDLTAWRARLLPYRR
jgi:hypothetical protein